MENQPLESWNSIGCFRGQKPRLCWVVRIPNLSQLGRVCLKCPERCCPLTCVCTKFWSALVWVCCSYSQKTDISDPQRHYSIGESLYGVQSATNKKSIQIVNNVCCKKSKPQWTIKTTNLNHTKTLTECSLLIRGRKLFGSRRNVMSSDSKNLFIPTSRFCGLHTNNVHQLQLYFSQLLLKQSVFRSAQIESIPRTHMGIARVVQHAYSIHAQTTVHKWRRHILYILLVNKCILKSRSLSACLF